MSFGTINKCAGDPIFRGRVNGCLASQGIDDPDAHIEAVIWPVSSAADIEAAYASALAGDNPNPGGDEAVITDQMILSAVQANLPAP